jgi:hypothetical protein
MELNYLELQRELKYTQQNFFLWNFMFWDQAQNGRAAHLALGFLFQFLFVLSCPSLHFSCPLAHLRFGFFQQSGITNSRWLAAPFPQLPGFRAQSCLAVRTSRSTLLFDCGEDAQRRIGQQPHLKPGRIERICITCVEGDQVFGLPGASV